MYAFFSFSASLPLSPSLLFSCFCFSLSPFLRKIPFGLGRSKKEMFFLFCFHPTCQSGFWRTGEIIRGDSSKNHASHTKKVNRNRLQFPHIALQTLLWQTHGKKKKKKKEERQFIFFSYLHGSRHVEFGGGKGREVHLFQKVKLRPTRVFPPILTCVKFVREKRRKMRKWAEHPSQGLRTNLLRNANIFSLQFPLK